MKDKTRDEVKTGIKTRGKARDVISKDAIKIIQIIINVAAIIRTMNVIKIKLRTLTKITEMRLIATTVQGVVDVAVVVRGPATR